LKDEETVSLILEENLSEE